MKGFSAPYTSTGRLTRGQHCLAQQGPAPAWPAICINPAARFCIKKGTTRGESKFEKRNLVGFIDGEGENTAHLEPQFVHPFTLANAEMNPIDPSHPFRDALIATHKEAVKGIKELGIRAKIPTIGQEILKWVDITTKGKKKPKAGIKDVNITGTVTHRITEQEIQENNEADTSGVKSAKPGTELNPNVCGNDDNNGQVSNVNKKRQSLQKDTEGSSKNDTKKDQDSRKKKEYKIGAKRMSSNRGEEGEKSKMRRRMLIEFWELRSFV